MNMKKLITTAFLLMALANVSYGQDANNAEQVDRVRQTNFELTKLLAELGDALGQNNLFLRMMQKQLSGFD
jgi:hypothetical protein